MTYYQANTDSDAIICDDCGDKKWATDPRYGSNVDTRLEEAKQTGIRWSWVQRYSADPSPCFICNELTK